MCTFYYESRITHVNAIWLNLENSLNEIENFPLQTPWNDDRDSWWHDEMEDADPSCYPVWVSAEDPLFMLYTR